MICRIYRELRLLYPHGMASLLDDVSSAAHRLLDILLDAWTLADQWPIRQYVAHEMAAGGLDLREVPTSFQNGTTITGRSGFSGTIRRSRIPLLSAATRSSLPCTEPPARPCEGQARYSHA